MSTNFKSSTAGHLLGLKDEKAQLPAVCFRNAARLLRFRPENGKTFRARGRITTYEVRGAQLIVEVLEPVGLGLFNLHSISSRKSFRRKDSSIRKESARLLALPGRSASSRRGREPPLRDILTVLKRRHNSVNVLIFPVRCREPAHRCR